MKYNKRKLFLLFIFVFFCQIKITYADTTYVSLRDAVNIRSGAGTTYSVYKLGQVGSSYTLKNENIIADIPKNGDCDAGWYEIDYEGKSGYVCSEYVNKYTVSDKPDTGVASSVCEKEMEAAGFPSSYWQSLCSLKQAHPTWNFKAVKTNLDFITAVNKFTNCRDALVSNPKSEWQDSTCTYSEGSFKPVNQSGVAYYLDPRNFLNERYIFQFADSRFNTTLKPTYQVLSKSIVQNTAFYKYHLNTGVDMSIYIASGGEKSSVSPTHLASRMYQELGTNDRLRYLYQGNFKGISNNNVPINPETNNKEYDFRGYYNFYNIGVTGSCVTGNGPGATYCGLTYAKNHGWNSIEKAIMGGGEFLKTNYIDPGQYTLYFERFNVVPVDSSKMYVHYYMANLGAPSSESSTTYNAYKSSNLLENPFIFYIPVYNNMGAIINNSGNGATGDNGSSSAPSTTAIATLVTSAGYRTSGGYITAIKPETDANTIINNIKSVGGLATITNAKGTNITNGVIGTGFKINIKNANDSVTYTVVIKGDTSGDGKINAQDLLQIQKNILGSYNLVNEYKLSADTSGDGKINAQDLLQVQKNILGSYTIIQ